MVMIWKTSHFFIIIAERQALRNLFPKEKVPASRRGLLNRYQNLDIRLDTQHITVFFRQKRLDQLVEYRIVFHFNAIDEDTAMGIADDNL